MLLLTLWMLKARVGRGWSPGGLCGMLGGFEVLDNDDIIRARREG